MGGGGRVGGVRGGIHMFYTSMGNLLCRVIFLIFLENMRYPTRIPVGVRKESNFSAFLMVLVSVWSVYGEDCVGFGGGV